MIVDKFKIRAQNEAIILKSIIDHKNISRADLAKLTNLNKASVSSITKTLLEDELVLETGIGNASAVGGRKPVQLQFNPKVATVLSLDVGVDFLKGFYCYLDGKEIAWIENKNIVINKETIISQVQEMIQQLTKENISSVVGLCLGIHGVVDRNQIAFTPYYDLHKMDLLAELEALYSFPIYLENEANLAALGEYSFSLPGENLISLSVHSGIGAGIVVGGKLSKGQNGEAGEVGHAILYPAGKLCPCGNHGCLEQYASNAVLYEQAQAFLPGQKINSTVLEREYLAGNVEIQKLLFENAYLLSIGITNIATIYDPETVVINSSIYSKVPALVSHIRQHLRGRFTREVHIVASQLGEKSTVYGGVVKVCQNFLSIQNLKLN